MTSAAGTERTQLVALSALLAGSAVAVDPWGWAPYGPLRWMVVSAAGAIVIAMALRTRRLDLHKASLVGWGLFVVIGVMASVVALDPLYTWIGTPDRHLGLFAVVLFFGLYVAGQQLNASQQQVVLRLAVISLAAIGIYTLLELLDTAPVDLATASGTVGGPYGNAAYLAAACALLIPVAFNVAAERRQPRLWRLGAIGAVGLGIAAVIASQTRSGWVGLAVAFTVSLPATWRWFIARWPLAIAGGVALIVVAVTTPLGPRALDAFDFDDGTARGRIDEWQVAAAVITNHPLTGTGFEGYRIAFAEGADADYERRYTRRTTPDRARNGALDVGASLGLGGMALYAAGMLFLMWRGVRGVFSRDPLIVGVAAATIAYIVQQQFLFPLAEIDPIFWLLAGILVAKTAPAGSGAMFRVPPGSWLVVATIAVAVLGAGALDVFADHRARTATELAATGDYASAVQAADDAASLRPDSIRYPFIAAGVAADSALGLATSRDRLETALELSPLDPMLRAEHASVRLRLAQDIRDPDELLDTIDEWEELVDYDPNQSRYRLELGVGYAVAGNSSAAEAQWLIAADLAPASTAPLTRLAGLYVDQARTVEARIMLERARAIDPSAPAIAQVESGM